MAALAALAETGSAAADEALPSTQRPKDRLCCAFVSRMPLHLGDSHMPIMLDEVISPAALGQHSYGGWARSREGIGLVYTRRGGFIDLGHTRDYADLTAYFAAHLRPLLAAGSGTIEVHPLLSERRVVITKPVPPELLDDTSLRIARRAAFEISVWTEVVQLCGKGKMRGAAEVYSAFTPDDLYSNLLGTQLGAQAFTSHRPYDEAMTVGLAETLSRMGALPRRETTRVLHALGGSWWRPDVAWPSADIAIARSWTIGPRLLPMRAPGAVVASGDDPPVALDVPASDRAGRPLTDYYQVELVPDVASLSCFSGQEVVTSHDLPALVERLREHEELHPRPLLPLDGSSPLTHYERGLRLVELSAQGGLGSDTGRRDLRGLGGGALTGVIGDTRGGDFEFARFHAGATRERGFIAGVSLFRSDAVYFCHDLEDDSLRAPLVSLLGPCRGGERFGLGGSMAEGFHDGRTGRTALRPLGAYGVWNVLGNGQSASYDHARLLVRGGGAIEHVWSDAEKGVTIPRVGGKAIAMARSTGGRVEARGAVEYRIDPAKPEDAALESTATVRAYFLLGGREPSGSVDAVDPWAVASIGLTSGVAYWSRPLHAFPDPAAPFVSAEARTSFQLLLTATLGFEDLVF